jgi:hypothetical protein
MLTSKATFEVFSACFLPLEQGNLKSRKESKTETNQFSLIIISKLIESLLYLTLALACEV